MLKSLFQLGTAIFLVLTMVSCTQDKLAAPIPLALCDTLSTSYVLNVKSIIDQSCAYSGCHESGGSIPGNFTTYNGLKPFLDNGKFLNRVITQRENTTVGMPPNFASGPKDLTATQLELIQCWLNDGYPEN